MCCNYVDVELRISKVGKRKSIVIFTAGSTSIDGNEFKKGVDGVGWMAGCENFRGRRWRRLACLLNDSHAMLRVEVSPVTEERTRNSTQITYSRSAGYSILFPLLSSDTLLIVNLSSKPSNHYRRARQSISRLQLYSQNNVNCSIKVRKPSFILYNTEA